MTNLLNAKFERADSDVSYCTINPELIVSTGHSIHF